MYNDEPYYFMKNLQGDVIAITDRNGTVVAKYSYDAWGVCTIEQDSAYCIGGINPYRYRGYYYDSEIGMYYLQSRYYDPAVGRFVNADDIAFLIIYETISELSLYEYCKNSTIMNSDSSGCLAFTFLYNYLANTFGRGSFPVPHAISSVALRAVSIYNYNKNKKITCSNYIKDQHKAPAKDFRMGYYKSSYNGCGWIAAYNCLKFFNKYVHPSRLIRCFETWGVILSGTFGIMPDAIADILKLYGLNVKSKYFINFKKAESIIKSAKGAIISYAYNKGAHNIFINWNKSKKQFDIYNDYPSSYNTIKGSFAKGKIIIAVYYIK